MNSNDFGFWLSLLVLYFKLDLRSKINVYFGYRLWSGLCSMNNQFDSLLTFETLSTIEHTP